MTRWQTQALLFDLDGVLVDSLAAVERVWRGWAREHGLDEDHVMRHVHGRPSVASVREFLPGLADPEAEAIGMERREMSALEGVTALPGAAALLRALPPGRWAIVTSCTRPLAEARARHAGLPFPRAWITAGDIARGKPDPEPYLKGARALGVKPGDCTVLEDMPVGVLAGKAAGARVIGVAGGAMAGALREAGADGIVPGCSALRVTAAEGGLELEFSAAARP